MKPTLASFARFWLLSEAYYEAAHSVLGTIRSSEYRGQAVMPCVFLYFRSIELALKAVLVRHKVAEKEITREIGHRIAKLLSRAAGFAPLASLGIGPDDQKMLERYSDQYANKWFEYSTSWKLPELDQLQGVSETVYTHVREYLRKA